jgi:hypothetical protein
MPAVSKNITHRVNLSGLSQWGVPAFKWIVFIASAAYLYKVLHSATWEAVVGQFTLFQFTALQWLYFGVAATLMFANWGIEAVKWRLLMNKLQRISFLRSIAAVFAGISMSLWMPNRAGEYIGRVAVLRPRTRIRGILATLIGGFAQLAVTLILGLAGLIYYIKYHWNEGVYFFLTVSGLGLLTVVLILLAYFSLNKIRYSFRGSGWRKKARRYLAVYSLYTSSDLSALLSLSALRYLVFSTQLVLMLLFFAVPVDIATVLPSVFLIFLVQTVVPTTSITELAVRGAASVSFLEVPAICQAQVLASTYSIWLLNIILPSLAGAFVLLFTKLNRK